MEAESPGSSDVEPVDILEGFSGTVEHVSIKGGGEEITELVASQVKYATFKVLRS